MTQTKERRREVTAERNAAGVPRPRNKPTLRYCWRCGVEWAWNSYLIESAPCKDCRDFMRNHDGDRTVWGTRSSKEAPREAA